MQSTNTEFDFLLENVTRDLKRHTGNAELASSSRIIVVYSQGQSLKVKITPIISVGSLDIAYWIEIDDASPAGPFHKKTMQECHDSLYSLIISRLGDKVVNSLLK